MSLQDSPQTHSSRERFHLRKSTHPACTYSCSWCTSQSSPVEVSSKTRCRGRASLGADRLFLDSSEAARGFDSPCLSRCAETSGHDSATCCDTRFCSCGTFRPKNSSSYSPCNSNQTVHPPKLSYSRQTRICRSPRACKTVAASHNQTSVGSCTCGCRPQAALPHQRC
jgi:hypothetical protein